MLPTPSWKNESGTKTQSDIFISLISLTLSRQLLTFPTGRLPLSN
ncbi:Uncharacterised protein [Vibrio cholerae]|nr:Uncharacterised protein [Vibrio cholerae]